VLPQIAVVVTAGALGIWVWAIQGIHASRIGGTGFIDAVHPTFFVATSLLALAFVTALASPRTPRWLLVLQVASLIAMLYATVVIVEPLPRFNTAWIHAGFTDYIAQHGQTLPSYDARFSWPGFFSFTALLSRAAGLQSPVELLRWTPVYSNAVYAIGVYAIATTATKNERARWLAVWLFLSFNWVGQDYFSPQGFANLLAICCIVILLRWFRTPVPSPADAHFPRTVSLLGRAPDEVVAEDADPKRRMLLLALLLVLFGTSVVSHQLTPPVIVIWVAVLVITLRTREQVLPLALGLVFLLWLSFATVTYWSGHLHDIFGSLLQPGQALHQNLTSRVSGSASRLIVQRITLGFTALAYLLGGIGFLRRLRTGRGDLTFALLALAPFSVVFLQSYGGEALLRSVFLGLPFVTVLGAMAFFPRPTVPSVGKALCIGTLLAGMAPLFLVARYGNESWQYETPAEYAAFQYVYDHAPRGSVLVSVAGEVAWGYRDVGKIVLTGNQALTNPAVADHELSVRAPDAYLIVTKSQVAYGRKFVGLPANWARRLESALLGTGRYRVAFSNADAQVLTRANTGAKP
jgi:hypothetical protein